MAYEVLALVPVSNNRQPVGRVVDVPDFAFSVLKFWLYAVVKDEIDTCVDPFPTKANSKKAVKYKYRIVVVWSEVQKNQLFESEFVIVAWSKY